MPAFIYVTVVLEGRSGHAPKASVPVDLTCIRGLLEEIYAAHRIEFESAFGTVTVPDLLAGWEKPGLLSRDIPIWVEKLRKAAFEADNLGEAIVEFRNKNEIPDVAPGVIPVFCGILDYLAGCCGSDGMVTILPDET